MLVYIEPMYRGPCIGTIYPTLLGFGVIQAIILFYSPSLTQHTVISHANTMYFKQKIMP